MASLARFLQEKLRLQGNASKSAVDRPWNRAFLGYSVTLHRRARLKVAAKSVRRFKQSLRQVFRAGRGRRIASVVRDLVPRLRGWVAYFRLSEVRGVFESLDQWLRGKLRMLYWRQWKRWKTRIKALRRRGLEARRAACSAMNGRGPWWNAGASHMNQAVPTAELRQRGLVSLLDEHRRLAYSL
ncbi:MAG: hypothetical protein GVY16_09340 [Planctomycetes bacterium]|jgi:hypothetical protein|nr:hypothetical protein [Planctomycetota bacterium]